MNFLYIVVAFACFSHHCSASSNRLAEVLIESTVAQLKSSARKLLGEEAGNEFAESVKSFLLPPNYRSAPNSNNYYNRLERRAEYQPRVRTNDGVVIGKMTGDSHAFYGIPYAAPPIGTRRYVFTHLSVNSSRN